MSDAGGSVQQVSPNETGALDEALRVGGADGTPKVLSNTGPLRHPLHQKWFSRRAHCVTTLTKSASQDWPIASPSSSKVLPKTTPLRHHTHQKCFPTPAHYVTALPSTKVFLKTSRPSHCATILTKSAPHCVTKS